MLNVYTGHVPESGVRREFCAVTIRGYPVTVRYLLYVCFVPGEVRNYCKGMFSRSVVGSGVSYQFGVMNLIFERGERRMDS